MVKRLRLLLLAPLTIAASAAGAGAEETALRFRIASDPVTLDWNLAHTSSETYVIMNLMEGLVESGPESQPLPALADSWTVSPDGKTYTFRLKKGVKWSDGVELEASHFVASWLRLLSPSTKAGYASFLYGVKNAEAYHRGRIKDASAVGIRAVDRHTFEVTLEKVVPYFIHIPTFWVTFPIRPDLIRRHPRDWTSPAKLVTLGPYRLASWKQGKRIVLEKNPNYATVDPSAEGRPERVEIDVIHDNAKARETFYSGAHDLFLGATTADLLRARGGEAAARYRVEQFPYLATYYLGFNTRSGPLRDVNFRKAVALALELKDFPAELQGGQIAASGWIPPGVPGALSGAVLQGTLYDARAALARAGYGEGVGLPRLKLRVARADGADAVAAVISRSLREKLGIAVEPRIEAPAEFQKALRSDPGDLFVTLWGLDYPDPANAMEVFLSGVGTNYTGWSSKDYDALVRAGAVTLDHGKRLDAYSRAERLLLQDEVVIVPLFHRKNTVVLGPRVGRFHISPLNYLFLKKVRMN